MPQLDLITFFPQFIWCFLCFFSFFLYFSYFIIPSISTILKFRKLKLIALANQINEKKDGSSNLLIEHDAIINKTFFEMSLFLDKTILVGNTWVVSSLLKLNTSIFLIVNQRYLKIFFEKNYVNFFQQPFFFLRKNKKLENPVKIVIKNKKK